MKSLYSVFITLLIYTGSFSQPGADSISQEYITRTITWLASDSMGGRVNYTPRQLEVATFLHSEFQRFGLQPYPGFESFYQSFGAKPGFMKKETLTWNGRELGDQYYMLHKEKFADNNRTLADFMVIRTGLPVPDSILFRIWDNKNNTLLWIPLTDSVALSTIARNILVPPGRSAGDILIVATKDEPVFVEISGKPNLVSTSLYNVIGVLPGKSKPGEFIIFSAHYDHVEYGLDGETDIFNGANDNASGTTAVLALADYFSMRGDNERSIIFCLFAGEELGLLGSKAFVPFVDPEKIVAMINIEMIGRTNIIGRNAFFVTGPYRSDLYRIMRNSLKSGGSKVRVSGLNSDPRNLFERSDNYPFAQMGVPAHSVMCSDDMEDCYHRPCDDVKRIHLENMTRVIKALALACGTIISGIETPKRIR